MTRGGESVVDVPFKTQVVVIVIVPLLACARAFHDLLDGQGPGHEVVGVGDIGRGFLAGVDRDRLVAIDRDGGDRDGAGRAVHGLVNSAGRAGRDVVVSLRDRAASDLPGSRSQPARCRRR